MKRTILLLTAALAGLTVARFAGAMGEDCWAITQNNAQISEDCQALLEASAQEGAPFSITISASKLAHGWLYGCVNALDRVGPDSLEQFPADELIGFPIWPSHRPYTWRYWEPGDK
jgi:hypothetical protein